jgi:hypothetical protein
MALLPTLVPLQLRLLALSEFLTPSWGRNAVDVATVAGL